MFAKRHTNELIEDRETTITIDHKQRGLGTGSCGPQTRKEYEIKPDSYNFLLILKLKEL